jgi:hypothetical protein
LTERSKAQRAAEARYDAKRRSRPTVLLRLTDAQSEWIEQQRQAGDSRAHTVARLSGLSAITH